MPSDVERELVDWLIGAALDLTDEQTLFAGLCDRLSLAGVGITRAYLASEVLHPLIGARGFMWQGEGAVREDYGHDGIGVVDPNWRRSPFFHMLDRSLDRLHVRLDASLEPRRFPLLDRLAAQGCTDYLALGRRMVSTAALGGQDGILTSWTTMRPGGFEAGETALIERCMAPLALAFKGFRAVDTARTLACTYLGQDAGSRVLAGEIRRGEPVTIEAVLWYSDLEGFTRIADTTPADRLMALLNAYAEALVGVVDSRGGDVLKFMGDGILALFRGDDAAARALAAAIAAQRAVGELNAARRGAGEPVTEFYLGLHRGDVLYGNIGSRERLDFTVIGPAVNEVARIEAMCRSLDRRVVVSRAFAETAGAAREHLVSLGRYALRGVGRAQELYTIDPEMLSLD
ncbi:MAG: adenylate/guanylate cyclase domain-containing protein [Geminicoccaceae bacterium]|jgi:adenylate cyclase